MNIELESGEYKSIKSLIWNDIPEFVVVTGKNGSGKTQLLELINYHFGTNQQHKNNISSQANNPFFGVKVKSENCHISEKELVYLPSIWQLGDLGASNSSNFTNVVNTLHNQIIGLRNEEPYRELAEIVKARINKPNNLITPSIVQENLPIDYFDYINKIQIHEGLSEAFVAYHSKAAELRDEDKNNTEIESELGRPPWVVINELLESADFPYIVNKPKSYAGDYYFQLKSRKDNDLIVNFSDLSSGEKILISLGIWMFNTGKEKRLPKLLLLDEPDAHLHPSAIKQFIEVIENNLVKKHGVRVILTTHSPTTVSFSPEYSLFEMSKTSPQIKHLESKEDGINLLTEGLVVVKSNTKYVLVEDQDDANYYNALFTILNNRGDVDQNIAVIFIPSSNKGADVTGGCSVVKSWVEKFEGDGVFNVFQGLIDYDSGNHLPSNNIHILKRHSLENYLLDPILIFASILHESTSYNVPDIDISHKNEHHILNLPVDDLQSIADHVTSEIVPLLSGVSNNDLETREVTFSNGIKLKYPNWLFTFRGHDLYSKFKCKFQKPINYDNLIKSLIRHEFIPTDLVKVINDIQKK